MTMNYKIILSIDFYFHKSKNSKIFDLQVVDPINKGIIINLKDNIFSEDEIYFQMFRSIVPLYLNIKDKNKGIMEFCKFDLEKIISEEELFYLNLLGKINDKYSIQELKND